ncbi:MAG TPA: hypothetical protein VHZ24_23090 [Pirellulales bacterium]|jgi:hypothetical protein|nr:hypothetical protein [Pirellulales bacterium]
MGRVMSVLGWLVFLACVGYCLMGYGTHWGFVGADVLPATVLAPDGLLHYPDDETAVPAAMLGFGSSGLEGSLTLGLLGVLLAALAWLGVEIRKQRRMSRTLQELREQETKWLHLGQRKLNGGDWALHQGRL